MNESQTPTRQDIEALTAYLPKLYAEGFSPITRWAGGEEQEDGSISFPFPIYDPVVSEFFHSASRVCWCDYGYDPSQAGEMLGDENIVKSASLSQIKTMLTYCVRGERFGDGHWGAMIEQGYIRRLLERLEVIRSEMLE